MGEGREIEREVEKVKGFRQEQWQPNRQPERQIDGITARKK